MSVEIGKLGGEPGSLLAVNRPDSEWQLKLRIGAR